MSNTVEELQKEWKNEFGYWGKELGSKIVELIRSADYSQYYTIERAHIFRLENGEFSLVTESGCSCYSLSDAAIDLFPSLEKANESFDKWEKEQKESYA